MKKALRKDFVMEIRKSRVRFLSILFIVALGVAFFSGIAATSPDMRASGDGYYDDKMLMDLKLMGTMGLTEEDLTALEALEEIELAEGSYGKDVLCGEGDNQKVLHVEALSERFNLPTVTEGRLPEKIGECFLDDAYAEKYQVRIGDRLSFREEGENSLLNCLDYTVVGIGQSPMYISFNRGNTTLGTGEVSGFAVILPDNFDTDIYTQIYMRIHGSDQLTSYTDAYEELVSLVKEQVLKIEKERCAYRLWEVRSQAEEELEDGVREFTEAKEEARQELDEKRQELLDGEKQYEEGRQAFIDGRAALIEGKKSLEEGREQLSEARAELEDGRSRLADGRRQIETSYAELEVNQQQIVSGMYALQTAEAELNAGKAQLDAAREELESGKVRFAEAEAILEQKQTELAEGQAQIEEAKLQIENGKQVLDETEASLLLSKQQLEAALEELTISEAAVYEKRQQLNGAGEVLEGQRYELEAARAAELISEEEYAYQDALLAQQEAVWEEQNQELLAAEGQLAQTRAELETSLAQVTAGLAELENQRAQIAQQETEIAAQEQQLTEGAAQLEAGKAELEGQGAVLEASEEELTAREGEWYSGWQQLQNNKYELYDAQEQLSAGREQLISAEAEIQENEKKLNDGAAEIEKNETELIKNARKLKEKIQQLREARIELLDSGKKLREGKEKFESAEADVNRELSDAEAELSDARKKIEDLKEPEWYLTTRKDLPEYSDYGDNADRIRNIGRVFPVIFFLVAALISLTTMTRMVEDERTQIGTMKALGYSMFDIAAKYIGYALLATVSGSVLGVLVGQKIFPWVIIKSYGIMYHNFSDHMSITYELRFGLIASGAAVACTLGATLFSCYRELSETPASLMRPPAPKNGKRIWLEHIPFVWRHLNFTWKSTMRNLFRYKKRLFMTIFGIAGSMGLMLIGFGIQDSVMDVALIQYEKLQHYDGTIIHDEDAEAQELEELERALSEDERILRFTNISMTKMSVTNGHTNLSAYVFVPENLEHFREDVTLKNRVTDEIYELSEEGAVICEKTGTLFDLKPGDEIQISRDNKIYQVPIAAITENYMGHYIYMTPGVYEETFGEAPEFSDTVFTVKEEYKDALSQIGREILSHKAALSISYTASLAEQIERMLSTLDLVVIVLIVSAGMLAFVVLYNLNNINITERKRELATLKVLGFFDGEVSSYVFRENIVLTFIGVAAGAFFGIALHRFTITTVEVDAVMFGRQIKPPSFVYCALLTVLFSVVVNLFMYRKLKKIDMVESLKSVE